VAVAVVALVAFLAAEARVAPTGRHTSSRCRRTPTTRPPLGRPPTPLTPADANPPPRGHQERRLTAGVRFSIITKQTRPVRAAIHAIPEHTWVPIAYPHAIYDEATQQWISDAEIAETTYTAYRSLPRSEQITVRLIVRRVKDKNIAPDQCELFTAWRYHAFITDSTLRLVDAEKQHREHAIIEQVNADLKDSALAHMPSGSFTANAARLTLAAIAHNLTRAADALASRFHARARTLRCHLITLPARIARRSRRITLHLPLTWPHRDAFNGLFTASHAPPRTL
jgi:hypothetical protein